MTEAVGPKQQPFPSTGRDTVSWLRKRTGALRGANVSGYHADGGRLPGWVEGGTVSTPSVVAKVPHKTASIILEKAHEFKASLPEDYQPFVILADERSDVPDPLHVTFGYTPLYTPATGVTVEEYVAATVDGLQHALKRIRPFTMRVHGFETLPKVGVTRILDGAGYGNKIKAAIWNAQVPLLGGGDSPFIGPKEEIVLEDGKHFGMAMHTTTWVYGAELPADPILEALKKFRRYGPDGDIRVSELRLDANIHNGGTMFANQTLATFELGRGVEL